MSTSKILEERSGHAFMVLEELFWRDLLNKSLEKTQGNVNKSCDILGISSTTFRLRCQRHGVDIELYRDKRTKERYDRIQKRKEWEVLIKEQFRDKKMTVAKAARNLGWNRSTLYQRMRIVGVTQTGYKKWHLNIEGVKA